MAATYGVTTSYISKLMKPDKIAELHKTRDSELNLDALRTPTPMHEDVEKRLLQWIKIARARFEVRVMRLHSSCYIFCNFVFVTSFPHPSLSYTSFGSLLAPPLSLVPLSQTTWLTFKVNSRLTA